MNCDLCKAELEPVFADLSRRHDDDQWRGCLHIMLIGGYGEYIDNIVNTPHYRLCETCAEQLMKREPFLLTDP